MGTVLRVNAARVIGRASRSVVSPRRVTNDIETRGGPPGDRTRDTLIKSQVLYH